MKSLFFKIGDPISNLTELSSSVSSHANVETKNQSFQVIKTQEKSLFKEISTDLESKNKIIFNNLNKLQEEKKTLSEFFKNIKKEDLEKLSKTILSELIKENKISKTDYEKAINNIENQSHQQFKDFISTFQDYSNEYEFQNSNKKSFEDETRWIAINPYKGYEVNISEEENSKTHALAFEQLSVKKTQFELITKNLIPELKKWILAKKITLEAALAPSSASIVATGITLSDKIKNGKLFKKYFKNYYQNKIKNLTKESLEAKEQRLLKISLVSSAISLSFQYTIEQIEKHINDIQNQIKESVELYFGPHEVFNDFKNWHGKIWSKLSFTNEIISWVLSHYIPGNFPQAWYDRYLFYLKKTTSLKTFHFISLGNDLLAIWLNVDEIKKLDKALDYLDSKEEEFKEALETLNSGIESLREDKWVVVKESRKSDYYSRGGRGGKNLLFKNLKTDKVKTLEEMLEYSREELKLWGLQKVYNHKTGWYIRSIPNKDKSDNLG